MIEVSIEEEYPNSRFFGPKTLKTATPQRIFLDILKLDLDATTELLISGESLATNNPIIEDIVDEILSCEYESSTANMFVGS